MSPRPKGQQDTDKPEPNKAPAKSGVQRPEVKSPAFIPAIVQPQRVDTRAQDKLAHAIAAAAAAKRDEKEDRRRGVRPDTLYYLLCHHCGGAGIWMSDLGDAGLEDDQWWANYKQRGAPWAQTIVFCQVCLDAGHKRPLKVRRFSSTRFGPNPRMLRELPFEEAQSILDQMFGEPEHKKEAVTT